jgi:CubicO group peptidase (beta-lactamase class C family)
MKFVRFLAGLCAAIIFSSCTQPGKVATETEEPLPVAEILKAGVVPGAALARIAGGQVTGVEVYGVANAKTGAPVTPDTIFEAASLSKPVFTYAVMKMVERGELDLDQPISKYYTYPDIQDDPRLDKITARLVLSHTCGLPNWRPGHWSDNPGELTIQFEPGAKFSYSGEGYVYLQRAVAELTGMNTQEFIIREVFEPLAMTSSSYVWRDDYDTISASPHDFLGEPGEKQKPTRANAAASLHTTARDFALFVAEILNPQHANPETIDTMLTPQVEVEGGVRWALGWGVEPTADPPTFFHWGDNGDFRCFVMASLETAEGMVLFSNSHNGLAVSPAIFNFMFLGDRPSFLWLDYARYDSPGFRLRQRIAREGVAALLEESDSGEIEERIVNEAGYDLIGRQRLDDAIAVLQWNVEHFPESWNAYDSLGEAHAKKGNKKKALALYQKSLELNPDNKGAKSAILQLGE